MSWVVDAFGSWYLEIYPHRDDAEAARLVGTLAREWPLAGRWVLDVGCDPGRHLVPLRDAGAQPFGLDLSPQLLTEARRVRTAAGGDWPLVRADMRSLPFRDRSFEGVTSLFTSFGYFGEEEDRRVLAEGARVLAPGGFHLLDFLNPERVAAHPSPETERSAGAWRIRERRRIEDGRRVVKRVTVRPASGGEPVADYEERVMLYGADEVHAMLREAGLEVVRDWGEYDGARFDARTSSRHVFLSRRGTRCP